MVEERPDDLVEEERPVDIVKISLNNEAINGFFKGKPKNGKRIAWFNPKDVILPKELREICASMNKFFSNRQWYGGGPVPEELLYTKANFHLINNISLIEAIELAFDSIRNAKSLAKTPYHEDVDTEIALAHLRECEVKGVQQDHIAGLLLIYLDLCEKVVLL